MCLPFFLLLMPSLHFRATLTAWMLVDRLIMEALDCALCNTGQAALHFTALPSTARCGRRLTLRCGLRSQKLDSEPFSCGPSGTRPRYTCLCPGWLFAIHVSAAT